VYPAYVDANRGLFHNGDLEHGPLATDGVEGLVLIEPLNVELGEVVEGCCQILREEVEGQQYPAN